jgi:hypothetical protein
VKLVHFYHVYADGHWREPALAHVEALHSSGLIDELDDMFVGIVGNPDSRGGVKLDLPGVVVAEADDGWEQVTLQALHAYAKENSAKILYAHTKGAWSNSELARQWRVSMTHDTVTRWREAVEALDLVDTAGPFYIQSRDREHAEHKHFFGGNFWWARSQYLAKLPQLKNEHRFQAEGWIGLSSPTVTTLRGGQPTWGNFGGNGEA